jgi:hypothetical protein
VQVINNISAYETNKNICIKKKCKPEQIALGKYVYPLHWFVQLSAV